MYFNKNNLILIFLIILLIIIFYIINKYIKNYFEFFDICNTNSNEDSNISNETVTKKIIIGFDENGDPIEEEMTFTLGCAGKNKKCLVDPNGNNTCCDKNLKCIRKIGNFQNKVCSDLKDACDIQYNIFLRIFDGYYWNKLLSLLEKEEISKYEETKASVEGKVRNLCDGKNLDGQIFQTIVKSYLEELFMENEIFAEIIINIAII